MLLVVNYHYVRAERDATPRAIHPVVATDFAAQLDELGRSFEFVSRDQLLAAVGGGAPLPDLACLITLDDGLREQVEIALPLLLRRGVPALFFVSGAPVEERRVLYVHKVHSLREHLDDETLLESLEAEFEPGQAGLESVSATAAAAAYRYDTPQVAALKYLLNTVLGPRRPEPVDRVFAQFFVEETIAESLYASAEQVRELEALGALGAHGYSHRPLAVLGAREARADLERGAEVLERIVGHRPRTLSYPYGTPAAVDPAIAGEAAAAGFAVGMTLERAFNRTFDDPLLLARLDANDAPGGRAPLFAIEDGSIELHGNMTWARSRYLAEEAA
ncbi:MAG: polysaccharide deacetylase family protein [Gaiellaceae bacterium MAG52_C11]|nr:polysaccharide deacetylase family protein [Candidatus Gaiellasilicea maunaloa]